MILPFRKRTVRPVRIEGEVAYVTLTQGFEATIDAADALAIGQYNWSISGTDPQYANTNAVINGKRRSVGMHRFVVGIDSPMVDHINGDGLDNRRANLRPCAGASQNAANKRRNGTNTSGFKGVRKRPFGTPWEASIGVDGVAHYLGRFPTPEAAARAYDRAAKMYFGEFARPNFPEASAPDAPAKPKRVSA